MRGISLANVAAVATMALLILSILTVVAPFGKAHAATNTITFVSTGLVASDSLTTGNTSYWTFSNSGPAAGTYASSEDSQGLHIGAQSMVTGEWAYNEAQSPATAATLFHALVSLPYASVTDGQVNGGIYVEGQNGNYVDCVAVGRPKRELLDRRESECRGIDEPLSISPQPTHQPGLHHHYQREQFS